MKTIPFPRSRRVLKGTLILLAALSLASLSAVSAVITEKFDTIAGPGDPAMPPGWTIAGNGGTPNIGIANSGLGYNALRFARPSGSGTQNQASALYYTGTAGDIVGGKVADLTASVKITTTFIGTGTPPSLSSTYNGIVIRASSNTYNNSGGYYIGINGDSNGFGIWNNPASHTLYKADAVTQPQRALVYSDFFESAPDIPLGTSLLLSITAVGTTIEASVWTLTLDGVADVKIGELIYENATKTAAGTFGLRFSPGNTNAAAYYRDFNLQSIPEPSTVAMLVGAGAMVVLLRIRRRA